MSHSGKNISSNFFSTKIFRNIFLSFSISMIFLILFYSFIIIKFEKNVHIEVLHSRALAMATSTVISCSDAMLKDDMSFIVEYCMAVIKKNKDIVNIFVVNYNNQNISITQSGWRMMDNKLDSDLLSMQKDKEMFKLHYNPKLKTNIFHFSYPIIISGIQWGYIHILYSLGEYNRALKGLYKFIAILFILLLLLALIISYIISRQITLPILELSKTAEMVEKGNLYVRVNIERDDEIGEFTKNFNSMIEKLEKSHSELEKKVKKRTKELEELNIALDDKIKKAIIENSKKEQMLIQQSRLAAMGEMIGNIAHQWRQPLNALGLILQNIFYSYESGDIDREYLERSVAKGEKLTQLMSKTIDDFRDFFKPNKIKENFNISHSISNVKELISASYKNHNITISEELDDTLECVGYPNEFSQVLLNILTNAKDALIEKNIKNPLVNIRTYSKEQMIVIEIEDNAGGIDEKIINKIFDPYFTTKDKNRGTGIGLYMSKMIIENNMKGKIYAKNGHNGAIITIEISKKEILDA